MRSAIRPFIEPRLALLAGSGALALWSVLIWRALPRLTAYGPICGESDGAWLIGHCPLCFAAAALTGLALAALTTARRAAA